jgi:hypothetical protein
MVPLARENELQKSFLRQDKDFMGRQGLTGKAGWRGRRGFRCSCADFWACPQFGLWRFLSKGWMSQGGLWKKKGFQSRNEANGGLASPLSDGVGRGSCRPERRRLGDFAG